MVSLSLSTTRRRRNSASARNQSSSGEPPCLPRASQNEYARSAICSYSDTDGRRTSSVETGALTTAVSGATFVFVALFRGEDLFMGSGAEDLDLRGLMGIGPEIESPTFSVGVFFLGDIFIPLKLLPFLIL